MAAIAAFATSDTGRFLYAAGIDLAAEMRDPLLGVNLRAAQAMVASEPVDESPAAEVERWLAGA